MNTEQNITNDITAINPNLDKLKQAFPHCFDKNGDFDFAKFKTELSASDINLAKEGYSLDWLGKSYARLLASDAATTLLKEDVAHNAKPENTNSQNLLIKGDNLEVLKHLSNAYYEKVKMIYIDPPYNTGSDGFVYNDDRKFTAKQLQDLAGINEDEAKRILEFTQSNSNSHSAWLTFMYPRLYIAKQLLKEDGVIFVSIDDNEVAQLRLLMDEVFGEQNFITSILWKRKKEISNDSKNIAVQGEYILSYSKSVNVVFQPEDLSQDYIDKSYNEPTEEFPLSKWRPVPITISKGLSGGGYKYEIQSPNGKKHNKMWGYPEESYLELVENKRIFFGKNGDAIPQRIIYDNESSGKPVTNYWDNLTTNKEGKKEILSLFGDNIFSTPKPTILISKIISLVRDNADSIILDFFAGSGSTADSVMQLNSEDGGNRKYILVQLPELIDAKKSKVAYDFVKDELGITQPTIFEITKERIMRAAKIVSQSNEAKIVEVKKEIEKLLQELPTDENQAEIKDLENKSTYLQNQDLGFKVFETMPIWEDYDFKAEKLVNAEKLFDDDKLTDEDIKALFTTWKTYDGSLLTQSVELVDLAGYDTYYTKQKLYLMYKGFTTETLKALLEKIDTDANFHPTAIIAFGYYFESKALREIAENIKTYNNKKNIDIDFITRY